MREQSDPTVHLMPMLLLCNLAKDFFYSPVLLEEFLMPIRRIYSLSLYVQYTKLERMLRVVATVDVVVTAGAAAAVVDVVTAEE